MKFIEPHLDLLASERLFTSDQIANYLIFRNYPRQQVFFDTRHNFYGEKLGNEYRTISEGGAAWRGLLDNYKFNFVLSPVNAPIASLLQAAGGWRILSTNGKYILFQRESQN